MNSGKLNQARMQTRFREASSATREAKRQLKKAQNASDKKQLEKAQKAYDDAKSHEQQKRLDMFGVDTSSNEEDRRDL